MKVSNESTTYQNNLKDLSILELLETIFELAEGNFFVREGTEYWQIKLSFPFFGCDAVYSPLPGQKKIEKKNLSGRNTVKLV